MKVLSYVLILAAVVCMIAGWLASGPWLEFANRIGVVLALLAFAVSRAAKSHNNKP